MERLGFSGFEGYFPRGSPVGESVNRVLQLRGVVREVGLCWQALVQCRVIGKCTELRGARKVILGVIYVDQEERGP